MQTEKAEEGCYFPLHQSQLVPEAGVDASGGLVMVRLVANVFTYGASSFRDVFLIRENQQMVRLFVFVLQMCCDVHAHVAIETVVSNRDWNELFDQKLNNAYEPAEFRLWVPLGESNVHLFLSAISSTFAGQNVVVVEERSAKRAKIEPAPVLPLHLQPVMSTQVLNQLLQIYSVGRAIDSCNTAVAAPECSEDGMDDGLFVAPGAAESTESGKTQFLTDFLAAQSQFASEQFGVFVSEHDVLLEQCALDSYVGHSASGSILFKPVETLAKSGLVRWFQCGVPGSNIRMGTDIFNLCLPHLSPSDEEIRQKLMQVSAAMGHFPDISAKSLDELLEFDRSLRSSKACDPSHYSPIVRNIGTGLNPDIIAQSAASAPEELLQRAYYCIHGLYIKNLDRVRHAKRQGPDSVQRVVTTVVRNLDVLFGVAGGVQGVPNTYSALKGEMDRLHVLVKRGRVGDKGVGRDVHLAAQLVTRFPKTTKHTRLSRMCTKLCVGTSHSLRLLPQQRGIYVFLWLRTFALTINRYAPSFCGLLCGAPGGGKSQVACITLTDTIPSAFVRLTDGSSSKAITVDTGRHERDFQVNVSDEAPTTNSDTGSDSASDATTKMNQSLYVNGSITYESKDKNPVSGEWVLTRKTVISRGMFVFCTNNPHKVARAIRDRSCIFDVVPTTSADKRALSASSAVATANNPEIKQNYNAFKLALKFYCGLQLNYTGAHAVGIINDPCSLMFVLFESMLSSNPLFSDSLPARRSIDCLRLAEAIMIHDLTCSWHTLVGPKYNHARDIEILYYRAFNRIASEHIIAAYSIMQQTTSTNQQLVEVMRVLKDLIAVDDSGSPMVDGEYYVLDTRSVQETVKQLRIRLPLLGEGLCNKVFMLCQSGITQGNVHVKQAQIPGDGRMSMMVLTSWINTVRTLAEQQIVRVLHELAKNTALVSPSYENETKVVVFRSAIRKRLRTPGSIGDTAEKKLLAGLTEKQLKVAIEFLRNSNHRDTGQPLFTMPATATVARYVVNEPENFPTAEPSLLYASRLKMPKEEIMPIEVHVDLLDSASDVGQTTKSPIDDLFEKFLAISGGYNRPMPGTNGKGPCVFAGVSQTSAFTPAHYVQVDPNVSVEVSVRNTLSASRGKVDDEWLGLDMDKSVDMSINGNPEDSFLNAAQEDDDDGPISRVQQELFPPGQHTVKFTHESMVETKVAKAVAEVACIDRRLLAEFTKLRQD